MLISEQVKILLERMDLCPDEFTVGLFEPSAIYGQWRHIFREGAFNPIEKLLLRRKYYILRRKATQVAIIQTILKNSEPKQSEQVASDN